MSRFDFEKAKEIYEKKYPLKAIIMAAFIKADTVNTAKLKIAFPNIFKEVQERHSNPGGYTHDEAIILFDENNPIRKTIEIKKRIPS